jgi:ribosome-binding factor A
MPTETRMRRIMDRIQQDLSEMIVKNEIHDPRLIGISITDVKVDRELSYADIYVSAVEGHVREKDVMEGLERASGFIRRQLSSRVELRVFPRLRFHWDITPEHGDHIEKVLAEIRKESEKKNGK